MSLTIILGLAASAVTVTTGVVAGIRHFRKRLDPDSPLARLKAAELPLNIEVVPIRYEVSLHLQIPSVTLTLRAINYLNKPFKLEGVRAEYFHISQGPALENIPSDDYAIGPRQSREVYCRRKLLESEVKGLAAVPENARGEASLRLRAWGRFGKKQVEYRPGATFAIHGVIEGIPPPSPRTPE